MPIYFNITFCINRLWDEVQKASSDRGQSLESALDVAKRFWDQLNAVMVTLAELEDTLSAQPPPAAQPRAIQAQQVALQEIRHEIDHTKPEVIIRVHILYTLGPVSNCRHISLNIILELYRSPKKNVNWSIQILNKLRTFRFRSLLLLDP